MSKNAVNSRDHKSWSEGREERGDGRRGNADPTEFDPDMKPWSPRTRRAPRCSFSWSCLMYLMMIGLLLGE